MKVTLTYICFFISISISAQNTSISFNNIGLNQGLSQSCVVDIAFDQKGFVWMATQDGLNRYDGKDFYVIDKKFDDITSGTNSRFGKIIQTDRSLWLISKGGHLERYDLISNKFSSVGILNGSVDFNITYLLADSDKKIWIGTTTGDLILYNIALAKVEKKVKVFNKTTKPAINYLFKDQQQRLWIIGEEVSLLKNGKINNVLRENDNNFQYSCITEDKEGNMWLGSWGAGLFFKGKDENNFRHFTGYKSRSLLADLVIEDILADNNGKIWVGTYGKGLFIVDNQAKRVDQFVNDKRNLSSIPFNDVLSIKQDYNHGIWIGTDGGGVSYFNKNRNRFTLYNSQTMPADVDISMVRSITTDKSGDIFAGTTDKGLTKINYQKGRYKTWRFPSYKKGIYNADRLVSLFYNEKDNIIWIGTQGNGLILFDLKKEKIIKWFHPESTSRANVIDGTVWCIFPGLENNLWIGTGSNGLFLITNKIIKGRYLPDNSDNGISDAIRAVISINDSTLCIGFEKTGFRFFNTHKKKFGPLDPKLTSIFRNEGTTIKCLYYSKDTLWVGTGGRGILIYNLLNGKIQWLSDKDGLPNNTIYGILADDNGYLWVSTNKGLSQFNASIVKDKPFQGHFSNYTVSDGLQSNEFNTGGYYKAANGKLLFGGISGLNVFDPSLFKQQTKNVTVVITKLFLDNDPVQQDTFAPFKKDVKLLYPTHSIALNYAALDFSSSQQFHYYYKLDGYDKKWIDANQRNYASYTNVPAGRYNFLVKYAIPGNEAAGTITRIAVEVTGPFWKREWFMLGVTFSILAGLYALYRYRVYQLYKVVQIRQRIAADLHDDIGSSLSNINILSELSKNSLGTPGQSRLFLERISNEVHASSQSLDDIIWSINNKNDTWDEIFSRMRRYAAEIFENNNITYTLKFDVPAGHGLNMEKRRDIFLIYKEILNNIQKHAAATEVEIDMRFENKSLVMIIKDNGKGFDKDITTHRNGLKNMRMRIDRWRGNLTINGEEKGTQITIVI